MHIPQKEISFNVKDLLSYIQYKSILARTLHDQSVIELLPKLNGECLELGAGVHDYSPFAKNTTKYIRSDYQPTIKDSRVQIDATNIDLPDASFDSIVCMSALEHIERYQLVLSEIWRVLKPGGQLLLNVPWLFPFHGAPNDYFRFSSSALVALLKDFEILQMEAVGNYWLSQAVFLQRPKWSRLNIHKKTNLVDIILRTIGSVFMIAGARSSRKCGDDNYALLYSVVCRKANN